MRGDIEVNWKDSRGRGDGGRFDWNGSKAKEQSRLRAADARVLASVQLAYSPAIYVLWQCEESRD